MAKDADTRAADLEARNQYLGIIDDAWGSSAIEPWIPREGVEAVPELKEAWDKRQKAIADYRLAKGRPPTIPPTIIPDLEGINKENWCSIYNAMINPLIRIPIGRNRSCSRCGIA